MSYFSFCGNRKRVESDSIVPDAPIKAEKFAQRYNLIYGIYGVFILFIYFFAPIKALKH